MKKVIAYVLIALVLIGGCGVATISEHLTPQTIAKKTQIVDFIVEAGVGQAEDYNGFIFDNLAITKQLRLDLDSAYDIYMQTLEHIAEKITMKKNTFGDSLDRDVKFGEAREDALYNPVSGAVAVGLSLIGMTATGYLGIIRKRPKDVTPEEHIAALGELKGEVTDREKKLIALVHSVQKVIDAQPTDEAKKAVKKLLADSQLPDVQATVKEIKAKI